MPHNVFAEAEAAPLESSVHRPENISSSVGSLGNTRDVPARLLKYEDAMSLVGDAHGSKVAPKCT